MSQYAEYVVQNPMRWFVGNLQSQIQATIVKVERTIPWRCLYIEVKKSEEK